MADYLLIESRNPSESADVSYFYDLATGLARSGNRVTLFLVQNGVFPARPGTSSPSSLSDVAEAGVQVLADDFSLRERGIRVDALAPGIQPAPLDTVVDELAAGRKAVWH